MPREYRPPPMIYKIRVQNPEDAPPPSQDRFGREVAPETWGQEAWAGRRDVGPHLDLSVDQAVALSVGRTVFVIHAMPVSPNAVVVEEDGTEYVMAGPPLRRGGPEGDMLQRYLELHCERRTGAEVS